MRISLLTLPLLNSIKGERDTALEREAQLYSDNRKIEDNASKRDARMALIP